MKISNKLLKRIIKEEINRVLKEYGLSSTPAVGQAWQINAATGLTGAKPEAGNVLLVLYRIADDGIYYNLHFMNDKVKKDLRMNRVPEGGMGYGPIKPEDLQNHGERVG